MDIDMFGNMMFMLIVLLIAAIGVLLYGTQIRQQDVAYRFMAFTISLILISFSLFFMGWMMTTYITRW